MEKTPEEEIRIFEKRIKVLEEERKGLYDKLNNDIEEYQKCIENAPLGAFSG